MNDTSPSRTEQELCEALTALAGGVHAQPDAFRSARNEWRRRERRRRLVLAVLVAVIFTLATLIGLWVLNQAPANSDGIFSSAHPASAAIREAVPYGIGTSTGTVR
ncbi:hypothetical protein ACIRH0_42105 [Streptomyces sp. NPDC093675]|uniref:hypothetical protein n=1 Tax=Streptomyces sp. NPDC093675 TaxID=3366049 RepID=UPI0038284283